MDALGGYVAAEEEEVTVVMVRGMWWPSIRRRLRYQGICEAAHRLIHQQHQRPYHGDSEAPLQRDPPGLPLLKGRCLSSPPRPPLLSRVLLLQLQDVDVALAWSARPRGTYLG